MPDALVEVLAHETSGERAFLEVILYGLSERKTPLSTQAVRDVVYTLTGDKAMLPELRQLGFFASLDPAHLEIVEQLSQGKDLRPRYRPRISIDFSCSVRLCSIGASIRPSTGSGISWCDVT